MAPDNQLADIALPLVLILGMAVICAKIGFDVLRSDPQKYKEAQRRAGSMKNVVLGFVEPKDGSMSGGMAVQRRKDGKIVIVRTGQFSDDDINPRN